MNLFDFKFLILLQSFLTFIEAAKPVNFDAERDVMFVLWVRDKPSSDEETFKLETRNLIGSSAFDSSKPTTFLVHGFTENRRVKHHLELCR